jgi:hypothetical protein
MSIIGLNYPTLLDLSKQFTEGGEAMPLAELLTETNEALDDIPWMEANSTNGHRIATRTGLPASTWRKLNGGVLPTKSTYADVIESMGSLTQLGLADEKIIQLSDNQARARANESVGHITGMNHDFMQALFYGDSAINPEQFLGLAPRYSDITGPENSINIIDADGSSTDNASIWIVGWGPEGVMGIYPKGSQGGLRHEDMGVELTPAPDGVGMLRMYRDWFEWDAGIAIKNWGNVVRIANIDVSDLSADGTTGAKLNDLVVEALDQLDNRSAVRPVIYVPKRIRTTWRQQIANKGNLYLSMDEVAGRKVVAFDGVPVRRVDRLLETEARVV